MPLDYDAIAARAAARRAYIESVRANPRVAKTSSAPTKTLRERALSSKLAIAVLRRLRLPGDVGAGDTVERLAGDGGKTVARWYERITGRPCGCSDHRAKLNAAHPW